MFPEATLCSTPFIYTPSAIAIIYTSSTTLARHGSNKTKGLVVEYMIKLNNV
ncbi:NADH-ubiquinone oxidoreductase chain 4 [Phtheirospermum japonicum]|uniref:NADH-ubiquinone oxidoreductase chain 4 n=1 Tax=Phtheirospermum japonicum TaxID=374723 RepID=A0A830BTI4_9LAMI|nr:NADH-ubiquinone oxidoreductase chain 4 [Phtheirospermum japonicum]